MLKGEGEQALGTLGLDQAGQGGTSKTQTTSVIFAKLGGRYSILSIVVYIYISVFYTLLHI